MLSPAGIARLEPFWHVLIAALAERTRIPLARLVERTWRAFNGHLFAGEEERQNITRYLQLLGELDKRRQALWTYPPSQPGWRPCTPRPPPTPKL